MKSSVIWVLEHYPLEHAGSFGRALAKAGAEVKRVRLYAGENLPNLSSTDALLLMGGPMSVRERNRYRWLEGEIDLVKQALGRDLPVLGVCLGSQILALAAGAAISAGRLPEIGWYQIELCPEASMDPILNAVSTDPTVFQWHAEGFSLPEAATLLARSPTYAVQAFRVGRRAYGFLFHLEVNQAMVAAWKGAFEVPKGPVAEPRVEPAYEAVEQLAHSTAMRLFLGRQRTV